MQRQLGELQQKDREKKKWTGLCGSVSDPRLLKRNVARILMFGLYRFSPCAIAEMHGTLQDELCESRVNAVKGTAERLRLAEQEAHYWRDLIGQMVAVKESNTSWHCYPLFRGEIISYDLYNFMAQKRKKNRASMLHPSPSDNHPGPCFLDTFRLLITEFIYWNFDLTSLERSKKLEPYEDCTPHPHLPHQVEVRSKEFEEDKRKREIWPTNSGVADGWGVHVYMGNLPWSLT